MALARSARCTKDYNGHTVGPASEPGGRAVHELLVEMAAVVWPLVRPQTVCCGHKPLEDNGEVSVTSMCQVTAIAQDLPHNRRYYHGCYRRHCTCCCLRPFS